MTAAALLPPLGPRAPWKMRSDRPGSRRLPRDRRRRPAQTEAARAARRPALERAADRFHGLFEGRGGPLDEAHARLDRRLVVDGAVDERRSASVVAHFDGRRRRRRRRQRRRKSDRSAASTSVSRAGPAPVWISPARAASPRRAAVRRPFATRVGGGRRGGSTAPPRRPAASNASSLSRRASEAAPLALIARNAPRTRGAARELRSS